MRKHLLRYIIEVKMEEQSCFYYLATSCGIVVLALALQLIMILFYMYSEGLNFRSVIRNKILSITYFTCQESRVVVIFLIAALIYFVKFVLCLM